MTSNLVLGMGLVVLATLFGAVGAVFFKLLSGKLSRNLFGLLKLPVLYWGLFFYGTSAVIFVFALQFGDLSTLYPMVGLSYVWISLLSIKFLNEKMNDYKWFGIGLIVIGVVLVGLGA